MVDNYGVTDDQVKRAKELGIIPSTDKEWEAYLSVEGDNDDWKVDLVVQGATQEESRRQHIIEDARDDILEGMGGEVEARLKIVKALLILKQDDLWRSDTLLDHYEETPKWDDYMRELAAWLKEQNPQLQASRSTLWNYIKYYRLFVEGYGMDEGLVFGANEQARRDLMRMVRSYNGLPKALAGGFDVNKLPQPAYFTGAESVEEKVVAGFGIVANDVLSTPIYSRGMIDDYKCGDGEPKHVCNLHVETNRRGVVTSIYAFVKKVGSGGEVLESYRANLLTDEMPIPVIDWFENRGATVHTPE